MLYYLFDYLEKYAQIPGASLFGYLSFRAALAVILSLVISMFLENISLSFCKRNKLVRLLEI